MYTYMYVYIQDSSWESARFFVMLRLRQVPLDAKMSPGFFDLHVGWAGQRNPVITSCFNGAKDLSRSMVFMGFPPTCW